MSTDTPIGRIFAGRFEVDATQLNSRQPGDCAIQRLDSIVDQISGVPVTLVVAGIETLKPNAVFELRRDRRKFSSQSHSFSGEPVATGIDRGFAWTAVPTSRCRADWTRIDARSLLEKFRILIPVVREIQSLHRMGLIHGNIRSNEIFSRGDLIFPGGFDVCRYVDRNLWSHSDSIDFAGYVSPELSGALAADIGPASDIYSIGVLLFRLFAGSEPFHGSSVGDILFQHLTSEPDWSAIAESVPEKVIDVLRILLAKNPNDRYSSIDSLLYDLVEIEKRLKAGDDAGDFILRCKESKSEVSEPAFVGREPELEQLHSAFEQSCRGEFQSVLVGCPSGVGKSRLLHEFIRRNCGSGTGFLITRASNEAGCDPMGTILSLLHQAVGRFQTRADGCEILRQRIRGLEHEFSIFLPDFCQFAGIPRSDSSGGPEEFGRSRTERSLAKLIAATAGSGESEPVLIWVDDCQWLEDQALRILDELCKLNPPGILLVCSMRTEDAGKVENVSAVIRPETDLRPGPLGESEIRLMQESMTGPLPAEAAETVTRYANGSPFMAAAVVRGMFETSAIVLREDGWVVNRQRLEEIQAADSAARILINRLQILPAGTRELLSLAAVVGKEFDPQIVSEIWNRDDFENRLDDARDKKLIWLRPGGSYCFTHDKIRESVLKLLDPETKSSLHLTIAGYLKQNRPDSHFDLAFHYHRANRHDDAFPFAILAARAARRRFFLSVAREQLMIACSGLETAGEEQQHLVFSSLAEIEMLDGRYDESEKWLARCEQGPGTDEIDRSHLFLKRGELEFKRGNKKQAVQYFERALTGIGEKPPTVFLYAALAREIAVQSIHSIFGGWLNRRRAGRTPGRRQRLCWQLYSRLAHGYWYTSSKYHTLFAHLRGMNLSETFEPTPELAMSYSEHGPALSLIPWHSRGLKYVDRSLELRKKDGDTWGRGQSRNFRSIILYSSARFEESIEEAGRAVQILERTGDYWEMHIARYQRAASNFRLGNLKEAVREAVEVYQSANDLGDFQATANIIDVWIRANRNRIPEEILQRELDRAPDDLQAKCQVCLARGIHAVKSGDADAAIRLFRESVNLSSRAGVLNCYISPNYAWLATAMRVRLESNRWHSRAIDRTAVSNLVRTARRAVSAGRKYRGDLPHALRELGAAYALAGKFRSARKTLRKSIVVAESMNSAYEAAQTRMLFADLAREIGWDEPGLDAESARAQVESMENGLDTSSAATDLSVSDRFDSLLQSGMQITRALNEKRISVACTESAKRLLRTQRCFLIDPETLADAQSRFDSKLVQESRRNERTVVAETETLDNNLSRRCEGSYLATPVRVNGKVDRILYAANDAIVGLFGEEETKIAEFLAATTGAALENASSFENLENVNLELEKRVAERTSTIQSRSEQLEATAARLQEARASLELARDEAERASSIKSQFLANVSHEIRTPISCILGFTELMLRGVARPEDRDRQLQTILQNGRHLLRLVNSLLDLSKVEAGHLELEPLPFNPCRIVQEVAATLKDQADAKGLALQIELESPVPREIVSDPTRLRQILSNLVGNAVKFTEQGSVCMTVRHLPAVPEFSSQIVITVEDTGIGMSDSQLEKVFDPFTQADSSVTRRFGGTGLGLCISRRLATALGGSLTADSEPGTGSRFTLSISAGDQHNHTCNEFIHSFEELAETAPLDFQSWDGRLTGRKILVVDDVATNRELLTLVLEDAGAVINCAGNGKQAVETATASRYDLIIMDMQMPVMDGYSATRAIKSALPRIPVVALTANSMTDDDRKCIDAGCSDYLSKPVDMPLLIEKITQLTSREDPANRVEPTTAIDTTAAGLDSGTAACGETEPDTWLETETGKLRDAYVRSLPEKIELIQAACRECEFEKLSELGHAIQGASSMVGIPDLSELGEQLCHAGRMQDYQSASEALESIVQFAGYPA